MAKVSDIIKIMQEIAPECHTYKDGHDNVGLLVGKSDQTVTKVLCCLDASSQVLQEAIQLGCQLIVSHHPVVFYKLNVNDSTPSGRLLLNLVANNISVYSAHTNLDFVTDGINEYISKLLGIHDITPIESYIDSTQGFGRVGHLESPTTLIDFARLVSTRLQDDCVRIVGDKLKTISKIAVINGGGGGDTKYIDWAIKCGADALVTADVKHHVAIYAQECGIALIEPQHYTSEHPYISVLKNRLNEACKKQSLDIEIIQSLKDYNPRTLCK